MTQEDTIFVSGMPDSATEDDVKDHFGSIGIIKVRPATPSRVNLTFTPLTYALKEFQFAKRIS